MKLESSTPCPGGGGGKRKRAFRRALRFLYRRAASVCRFLVRRFVVFVVSSFVVSSLYRVFYMSSCRSLVRRFGVLSFCRFVVSSFRRSLCRRRTVLPKGGVVLSFPRSSLRCFVVSSFVVSSFDRWLTPEVFAESTVEFVDYPKIYSKLQ